MSGLKPWTLTRISGRLTIECASGVTSSILSCQIGT